jgi:flagellar biosynthesis protein FliQ
VIILIVAAFTGPFVGAQLYAFTEELYAHIERGF